MKRKEKVLSKVDEEKLIIKEIDKRKGCWLGRVRSKILIMALEESVKKKNVISVKEERKRINKGRENWRERGEDWHQVQNLLQ